MRNICAFLCLTVIGSASAAPAEGFVFPDERREKKLEPITPPVLPYLEHLERDPSTLLPHEKRASFKGNAPTFKANAPTFKVNAPTFKSSQRGPSGVKPRLGFGASYNVAPSPGGLTASVSSSASGAGVSHSASQSFSFGYNEGFGASHSASQASSFNGFGSGFSGSQASSQAGSFGAGGASAAASQAASFGGGGGSHSASSAFGFNSPNGNGFHHEPTFGEGIIDVRHRGVPDFPSFPKGFPQPSSLFNNFFGKGKGVGAAAFRSGKPSHRGTHDDILTILVSD